MSRANEGGRLHRIMPLLPERQICGILEIETRSWRMCFSLF
jgi:hypothetical protein